MSATYLLSKSEPDLAALQTFQTGNTCTLHAISAALHLLLDYAINPQALSDEVDRLWWRGRPMRTFPKWAVTPRQQRQIVRYLAKTYSLPLSADFSHSTLESLQETLVDPDAVPLITILWLPKKAPPIYHGTSSVNYNAVPGTGGHTMLLAAHDHAHFTINVGITPWGFINSWCNGGNNLFWMKDEEFVRSWGFWLPLVGPNPLMVIRKTDV